MARVPTEVVRVSEVAGKGPPWTMAWPTSTPVGQPLTMMRPDLLLERRNQACRRRVVRFGELQGSGELAFEPVGGLDEFLGGGVADHQGGCAEDFLRAARGW